MKARGILWGLAALTLAVALGLALRGAVLHVARVEGTSMEDTLRGGDLVLVNLLEYGRGRDPGRGEVAECRFAGRSGTYIKRIIGLPGDEVRGVGGMVFVNGVELDEPYVSSHTEDFEVRLAENEYFVLGDNRADSYDSRMPDMGPVNREDLLGRVCCVLWPLSRVGGVH